MRSTKLYMQRRRRWIVIGLSLAMALAACSADGEGAADATDATTEAGADVNDDGDSSKADESSSASSMDLVYATVSGEGTPSELALDWLFEELDARTSADISVESFRGGSLLDQGEMLRAPQDGRIDMGLVAITYFPGELPLSNVVGVPFMTDNDVALGRAMAEMYAGNSAMQAEWDRQGVIPLIWYPLTTNIIGSSSPIETLDDLEGMQIRALGYMTHALEAVGANPVALAATEMFEGLQRGLIDAYAHMSFEYVTALGLEEVAPYIVDTGIGTYNISVVVVSAEWWESLDTEVRDTLRDLADEYLSVYAEMMAEQEASVCDQILDSGAVVSRLDEAVATEWQETVGNAARDAWIADAVSSGHDEAEVQAFLEDYTAALESAEAASTERTAGVTTCANRSG